MRFRRKLLSIIMITAGMLCLMPCFVLPGYADDHADDIASIKSAIEKSRDAFVKKDLDKAVAFAHPSFIYINLEKQEVFRGKAEFRKRLAKSMSQFIRCESIDTIKNITFSKEGATVSITESRHYVLPFGDQKMEVDNLATYRDFWVKTPGGWLKKRNQIMSRDQTTKVID